MHFKVTNVVPIIYLNIIYLTLLHDRQRTMIIQFRPGDTKTSRCTILIVMEDMCNRNGIGDEFHLLSGRTMKLSSFSL